MDTSSNSPISALQAVKERMKEKINGTLKAAKLQKSLAAKIKSKNFNNSAVLKISLKHNNRTLACALTAEKEKARSLESDKMILQKEVKMLHFQNALLRQNLSIVNRMLKDIDFFMNVNLPAAIEISGIGESSDVLDIKEQESKRFSHESRLSSDVPSEFRLTGLPLRVPSSLTEQQKCSNVPAALLNKDKHIIDPQSTDSISKSDEQHESEMFTSALADKERRSTYNRSLTRNSSLNSVLALDEDMITGSKSSGFVTLRRKRSTASSSSTQSVNSDFNQSKNSLGIGRESCCSTDWGLDKHSLSPHPGYSCKIGGSSLGFDSPIQKDMLSKLSCSPLSSHADIKVVVKKENKDIPIFIDSAQHPVLVNSGDLHPIADRAVEQEKTVYEADMEMTSSDSAAIVAVMPKRKKKNPKSNIPVKQDGASLRKVKTSAHEKTKKSSSSKVVESCMPSTTKYEMEMTLNTDEDVPFLFKHPAESSESLSEKIALGIKLPANIRPDSSDKFDMRRTYVLPGPVNKAKTHLLESEPKGCTKNEAKPSADYSAEESLPENIPMEIRLPEKLRPDSSHRFVLPDPANKVKTNVFESEAQQCTQNKTNPSALCTAVESLPEDTDENIPLEIGQPAKLGPELSHRFDSRRTFVLPDPVNKAKTNVYESEAKQCSKHDSTPSLTFSVEESFIENIEENIPLPAKPDLTYDSRRTYVLPGPVNVNKKSESEAKIHPKTKARPPGLCNIEEIRDLVSADDTNLPNLEEHGANDMCVKKRKSKQAKKLGNNMEHCKKKRKITTNSEDQKDIGGAQESHKSNKQENDQINETILISGVKSQELCIRRETYVLSSTKPNSVHLDLISKDNAMNCRRETFVMPNPLTSVSEENADSLDHPLQLSEFVSKDFHLGTEDVIGMKKTDLNIINRDLDREFKKPSGGRKSKCKENDQNKRSSKLFSQIDKRKTRILCTNQNELRDKDTLVRESCVNLTQSHFNKPTKFLNHFAANEQDSFMLDMVSESILDASLDCPSFVEFPSTNNLSTASMCEVSLNNIPVLDPPVSDDHDTLENEVLDASKSSDGFDENDNGVAQEKAEDESLQCCKVENQSMEINEADIKPFQDLTNKTRGSTKQSPQSCPEDQEEAHISRRRRNPVNYKEPSLGTKLRRGDTSDNSIPSTKGKGKKGGRGKKTKIKSEECPTKSV